MITYGIWVRAVELIDTARWRETMNKVEKRKLRRAEANLIHASVYQKPGTLSFGVLDSYNFCYFCYGVFIILLSQWIPMWRMIHNEVQVLSIVPQAPGNLSYEPPPRWGHRVAPQATAGHGRPRHRARCRYAAPEMCGFPAKCGCKTQSRVELSAVAVFYESEPGIIGYTRMLLECFCFFWISNAFMNVWVLHHLNAKDARNSDAFLQAVTSQTKVGIRHVFDGSADVPQPAGWEII